MSERFKSVFCKLLCLKYQHKIFCIKWNKLPFKNLVYFLCPCIMISISVFLWKICPCVNVCVSLSVCFLCFSSAFSSFSLLILSFSSWSSCFILFSYLVLDACLLYISLCRATEFVWCLRAQRVWVQFPTLT